jgi:hypothetical protein
MEELAERLNRPNNPAPIRLSEEDHDRGDPPTRHQELPQPQPQQPPQLPGELQPPSAETDKTAPRNSGQSVESFYSVNSGVRSSQSISRRTFKVVKSISGRRKTPREAQDAKLSEFQELSSENSSLQGPHPLSLVTLTSQLSNLAEAMTEWNEKQYEVSPFAASFHMTAAEASKLSSHSLLDEAINKLEDYYTFYFHNIDTGFTGSGKKEERQLGPTQGWLFRKSPEFKSFYLLGSEGFQTEEEGTMMAISLRCNTSHPLEFLKWYNLQSTQAKLFNFEEMRLVENGAAGVFEVEQYGMDLKEKSSYLLVRQIETIKFDSDPDCDYVVQLDTTFRKGRSFKSLLRFENTDNGLVEIYCESGERLAARVEDYFSRRWEGIEKMVQKKMLKLAANRGHG